MVAGGIGQTPFLPLAREVLGRQTYGTPEGLEDNWTGWRHADRYDPKWLTAVEEYMRWKGDPAPEEEEPEVEDETGRAFVDRVGGIL